MKIYFSFFKKLFFISLPVLILLCTYLYFDPFKVLYHYNSYYKSGYPTYVTLNKDFISTQTYINNSKTINYDAFIFGNSRTIFYRVETWKKYIDTDNCFHFDGSGESLLGIYRKIKFVNEKQQKIKYAFIALDYEILSNIKEGKGHLFLSHPVLSGQNRFSFQFEYFKAFLSKDFFRAYLDFAFSHKMKDYIREGGLLNDIPVDYNLKYNEVKFSSFEKEIKEAPEKFYDQKKMAVFYKRDTIQKYYDPVIAEAQYKMLNEIASIFKVHNTEYKIIINPLYDQVKLSNKDLKLLQDLFGKNNVYDFSGINFITNDYHNYYENSHYRPHIADYVMSEIYKN